MDAYGILNIQERLASCLGGMLVTCLGVMLDIRLNLQDVVFIFRSMEIEQLRVSGLTNPA
jgi:hypothetical protein